MFSSKLPEGGYDNSIYRESFKVCLDLSNGKQGKQISCTIETATVCDKDTKQHELSICDL